MLKVKNMIDNQEGSAIVLVLILLVLVMILGASSTTTSSIESQIVRNEALYKTGFYNSESAAKEAIQIIELSKIDDPDGIKPQTAGTFTWIQNKAFDMDNTTTMKTVAQTSTDPNSSYAAKANGIAAGSPAEMTATSHLYDFDVHGLNISIIGNTHVKIGYRTRF